MAYHIYAERTSPTAPSQVQSSLGEQVPKSDAMAVAERIVKRYNANDLDGLYAEFSDVARMQFSKEKLHESMGKQKWPGLFEQLFPKDKWSHSWVDVLGKAR
jgi:hypothetical protein